MAEEIHSIKDTRVVAARALAASAGRDSARKCLLEGEEILGWALAAGVSVEHVFFHAKLEHSPILAALGAAGIPCLAVSDGILKKISGTHYLIPVIGVGDIAPVLRAEAPLEDFVIVLDDVRDFGNLGTIVRTARAFAVRDLVTTAPDVDFWYRKVIESSRGKVFDVRIHRFPSAEAAIGELHRQGFQVISSTRTSPATPSG